MSGSGRIIASPAATRGPMLRTATTRGTAAELAAGLGLPGAGPVSGSIEGISSGVLAPLPSIERLCSARGGRDTATGAAVAGARGNLGISARTRPHRPRPTGDHRRSPGSSSAIAGRRRSTRQAVGADRRRPAAHQPRPDHAPTPTAGPGTAHRPQPGRRGTFAAEGERSAAGRRRVGRGSRQRQPSWKRATELTRESARRAERRWPRRRPAGVRLARRCGRMGSAVPPRSRGQRDEFTASRADLSAQDKIEFEFQSWYGDAPPPEACLRRPDGLRQMRRMDTEN